MGSLHSCPACVTGKKSFFQKEGEVIAIKDANACNGSDCTCRCHELWEALRKERTPIGRQ